MHPYLKERETAKSSMETNLADVLRRFFMCRLWGRRQKTKLTARPALPSHFVDVRGTLLTARLASRLTWRLANDHDGD